VVLDRHFDGKERWDQAAESVKDSCERIGLPRPDKVLLHPVSMFEGVPHSNEFPFLTRKKDGGRMQHAHTVILFGEKVEGPVVVGAGRYRGYGLCRPVPQGGEEYA
jgi:CRISPR-associated protein Csb2